MRSKHRRPRLAGIGLSICLLALASTTARAHAQVDEGQKVYQSVLKSVVWVVSPTVTSAGAGGGRGVSISWGSGSLVDQGHKLVLTNYHVVGDRGQACVFFPVYRKKELVAERSFYMNLLKSGAALPGKVVDVDKKHDLALIRLEQLPAGVRAIPLARETAAPGQRVYSVGNPGDDGALWVFTPGTVRAVYQKRWQVTNHTPPLSLESRIIETDSDTNHGDSGGPLVNGRGELVGVTHGHRTGFDQRRFAMFIESGEVKSLLKSRGIKIVSPSIVAVGTEASPAPKEVGTAQREESPPAALEKHSEAAAKEETPALRREKDALRRYKLAKMFADDGIVDKARARFQEVVDKFPETKAAADARKMLEKLDK